MALREWVQETAAQEGHSASSYLRHLLRLWHLDASPAYDAPHYKQAPATLVCRLTTRDRVHLRAAASRHGCSSSKAVTMAIMHAMGTV
jgi:hypothetical protein